MSNFGPRRHHQVDLYKTDKTKDWPGEWLAKCDDCPHWFSGWWKEEIARDYAWRHEQSDGAQHG